MEFNSKNKEIIGKAFFALSFVILIYMFVTPLNHLTHKHHCGGCASSIILSDT